MTQVTFSKTDQGIAVEVAVKEQCDVCERSPLPGRLLSISSRDIVDCYKCGGTGYTAKLRFRCVVETLHQFEIIQPQERAPDER